MELLHEANIEVENEAALLKKIWVKKGLARATYELRDKNAKSPEYELVLGQQVEVRK